MSAAGALVGGRGSTGIRHRAARKTSSIEELSERRSSIRKSLESGLGLDDDEAVAGPVKSKFMPFFRKFWPHLEREGSQRRGEVEGSAVDEIFDEPTDSLKSLNPAWYGKPVEEVDPYIYEDTFCVISKKYSKNYIYRFSCSNSLFLIGPLNPLRRLAIFTITHQWFDILIIFTILANCVTLAMDQNKFKVNDQGKHEKIATDYDETINEIEYGFLAIYTLEMLLKIIAKGFVFNKFSYLRNKWNMLDFVVVTTGYVTLADSSTATGHFEVLRTLRVLRAVKTISILPGLRMMINALLSSVRQLFEVMLLTLFCLMIFALFALEVYMGRLRQKCVKEIEPPIGKTMSEDELDLKWQEWVDDESHWQQRDYPRSNEYIPCANDSGTRLCDKGYVCLASRGDNPDFGWTSFDNFFKSMLTTFQLITLDYWERIYELVLSTSGPWSLLFFTMVVFLGAYYLLNLMLAVVAMSYEAEANSNDEVPLTKHQKLSLVRTFSTFSFEDLTKLNIKEMTYYRKRTASEREMIEKKLKNASLGKRKPRRAIRRKTQTVVKSSELTVAEIEPGVVGSPNVKSATGSMCGESVSFVGVGGEDEGGTSPNVRRSVDHSPSPRPPPPREQRQRRRKDSRAAVGKKLSVDASGAVLKGKRHKVQISGDSASSVINVTKAIPTGGKRVSGRVKAVSDKDGNRFILETAETEDEGKFSSAIMTILGKQPSPNLGEDMKEFELSRRFGTQASVLTSPTYVEIKPSAIAIEIEQQQQKAMEWDALDAVTLVGEGGEGGGGGGGSDLEEEEDGYIDGGEDEVERANVVKLQWMKWSLFLKTRLRPIVNHCVFEAVITICIVFNTVLLALEHNNMSHFMKLFLEKGNQFFMAIFTAEAVVKLLALQKEYFKVKWNVFDITIVLVSYLDFILDTYANVSSVRGFRLLRVFKLAQSWITMKVLLNIIFSTFGALGNLTLVLLIVIYIFSVMGMQVIGGAYLPSAFDAVDERDQNFPRWHFQNFWYAFMMIFRVLCGEWIEPLWDCLRAHEAIGEGEWKCFLIFLPTLIVGNFIVLNLFLALLLNSFNTEELKAARDKEMEATGRTDNIKTIVGMLLKNKDKSRPLMHVHVEGDSAGETEPKKSVRSVTVYLEPDAPEEQPVPEIIDGGDANVDAEDLVEPPSIAKIRFKKAIRKVLLNNRKEVALKAIEKASGYLAERQARTGFYLKSTFDQRRGSVFGLHSEVTPSLTQSNRLVTPGDCIPRKCWNADCFLFEKMRMWNWSKWKKLRQLSVSIVGHPMFEWLILTLIFASSITLAFEDRNLEQNKSLGEVLFYMNTVFTIIFFVEMILKWLAMGLWGYFTNIWTILDGFIVVVSLMSLYYDVQQILDPVAASKSNIGAFKALRTLRAFRPLRAISRWQGMKIVVNALMYAIPSIFNVLLVCLLFWLVFSIMGVQFFKGKFYKCVDSDGNVYDPSVVPDKAFCCSSSRVETGNYSWINTTPNFDNVLEGYLSLFQIATFEGWMELMRAAVDVTDTDKQPSRDNMIAYYIFFVIFIVFGAFFTLNLFIGVIIDNFNMLKKKYEGNLLEVLLTPSQRHYYTAMKKLGRKKPRKVIKRPSSNFISPFYDIAMSRKFEIAIFILIFINMVVMAFEHYGQRQFYVHLLAGFNSFFTTIYALEAIVKIIGLRQFYFTVPWNVFDFILVLASIVDLLVGASTVEFPIPPTMLRIVRVFRIGRVLRLVKAAKGIRKLLFALVVSLPALFNIGALLALITFIYAILGMSLLMTAAGWNDVLDALTPLTPVCGTYQKIDCDEPGRECPSRYVAVAYIVTYILISYLIVINMYIAIILENFVEANREEEVGIVEDDLEMFYVRWSRYDPQATQFINFDQLSDFLASLDPPLTLTKPNIMAIVAFNLPIARGNKIHCLDILHALVKHVLGQIDDSEEFRKLQEQMERKFQKQFPTRKLLDVVSSTRLWKLQHNAATVIQRAWRRYRQRKHPPPEKQKATQTIKTGMTYGSGHQSGVGTMLNRVGNLLHIVGSHDQNKKGRRESIAMIHRDQPTRGSLRGKKKEKEQRNSESSVSSAASHFHRLDTTGVNFSSGDGGNGSSRGRRLSPSRLSGGSFDAAVNFGNQLSVVRNSNTTNNNPPPLTSCPLSSCPTTPSPTTDDAVGNVIVQVHQF